MVGLAPLPLEEERRTHPRIHVFGKDYRWRGEEPGLRAREEWQRSLSDATLCGSCLKRIRAAATMGAVAGAEAYWDLVGVQR